VVLIVDDEEGRRQEGPVSGEDLETMLSTGSIWTETLVWNEGMTDWVKIGTVPDFSHPVPEESSPSVTDSIPAEPLIADSSADTTTPPRHPTR